MHGNPLAAVANLTVARGCNQPQKRTEARNVDLCGIKIKYTKLSTAHCSKCREENKAVGGG